MARFPDRAEIMRAINEQLRIVLVADCPQRRDVRRVGVHRKQAFRHNQDAVLGVRGANALQPPRQSVKIEMTMEVDVLGRRPRAFLKAGMGKNVEDDMVRGTNDALNGGEAGRPTGRIKDDVASVDEFRNGFFQHQRMAGVAEKRGGSGTMDAVFVDGGLGRLLHRRVRRQREIILRSEIDAVDFNSRIGPGRCVGCRRGCGRLRIGPEIVLAPQVLPCEESADAIEKVFALRGTKVPQ